MLNRDISAPISTLDCVRNKYGHLTSAVATLSVGTRAADNVAGGSVTLWQRRRRVRRDRFGSPAGWRREVGSMDTISDAGRPHGEPARGFLVEGGWRKRRTELEPCLCDAMPRWEEVW